jgi:hypothetical protein
VAAEAAASHGSDRVRIEHAQRLTADVQRRIAHAPDYMGDVGVGGELVPASIMGENSRMLELADTVQDPNYITVDASRDRLDLANEAGSLESALDAAETIDAANSLEKMLAHQLAAAHRSAMKLSGEVNRRVDYLANVRGEEQERANIQATRLAGATARMMATFQQGLLTLQRLRTGGTQRVIVQHVNVNQGGQAVVAGEVSQTAATSAGGQAAAPRRGQVRK